MNGRLVDVAVPVAGIGGALSYAVPAALDARCRPGVRVVVPVSSRKLVGLVLGDAAPNAEGAYKLLYEVVDDEPVASPRQIELVKFVSRYYLAPIGECARLVLPPDTGRDVDERYRATDAGLQARVFGAARGLDAKTQAVLATYEDALQVKTKKQLRAAGLSTEKLAKLLRDGLLYRVQDKAPPKGRMIETVRALDDGQALPARAPSLGAADAWLRRQAAPPTMAAVSVAFPGARGKITRLVELGRVAIDAEARAQTTTPALTVRAVRDLTPAQAVASEALVQSLTATTGEPGAFLLEGVTGSGKTEVYLRALQACLARGKGAIFLVPEISLTPQLFARVSAAVSEELVVLHSGLTPAERRDAGMRLRTGKARVALGARSALFAPVQDLGLIVVDEEHDGSLKQDETPRYHARDVALWRAKNEGAVCVLGSATPSLESLHNVEIGKLIRLELPTRLGGGGAMPTVEIVDLRVRAQHGPTRNSDRAFDEGPGVVLSKPLVDAVLQTLVAGEQVLLFLNRRGYSAVLLCEACGELRQCPHCSVSLTYHKGRHRMVCHQCDHEERPPQTCPSCGAEALIQLGLGTERLEAEVRAWFPNARVARLDRDTVKKRGEMQRVLRAVQDREVDVLVGTQMVAKGHDFPGIALVGVVMADIALALPDFRAAERAFSLLTQVAGRAGRGDTPGRVIIQTYNPEHPALRYVVTHDVKGFAAAELAHRALARYPPYVRAAVVRVEAEDPLAVARLAGRAAHLLVERAKRSTATSWDVLGPAPCPLERLRGKTRHQVLVKTTSVQDRALLLDAVAHDEQLNADLARSKARLVLDVDPIHML